MRRLPLSPRLGHSRTTTTTTKEDLYLIFPLAHRCYAETSYCHFVTRVSAVTTANFETQSGRGSDNFDGVWRNLNLISHRSHTHLPPSSTAVDGGHQHPPICLKNVSVSKPSKPCNSDLYSYRFLHELWITSVLTVLSRPKIITALPHFRFCLRKLAVLWGSTIYYYCRCHENVRAEWNSGGTKNRFVKLVVMYQT